MQRDGKTMAKRFKTSIETSGKRKPGETRGTCYREDLDDDSSLSIFEQIQIIARRDAGLEIGEKANRIFLTNWWCTHYSRPLKDPLLLEYTTEELAYEYYLTGEMERLRHKKLADAAKHEADKIEEERLNAASSWADQMEAQDAAEEAKNKDPEIDPLKDPKNIEWMEEEIKKSKLVFGEEFGEDISSDFEE